MRCLAVWIAVALGASGCANSGSTGAADGSVQDEDAVDAAPPGGDGDARPVDPGTDGAPPVTSCEGLSALETDQVIDIDSGGRSRQFRLHVPSSYDPTAPTPVVLNFHGYTSNARQQEGLSGLSRKADSEGFIAVHPDGVDSSWNAGGCCGTAQSQNVDDVGFVRDLLDYLETIACVDRQRVYATGLSNGGFMSHRLACELSDRIAAIGPVAGGNVTSSCNPTRPVPVMHFHGTSDTVVEYAGATRSIQDWAERNGCEMDTDVVFDSGNATCDTHPDCDAGVEVTLCTITGFGHWWPGAPGQVSGINATDAIWDFFQSHPLP